MEKLWGEYNTFDDVDAINNLSEEDVWLKIRNLGGYIYDCIGDNERKIRFTSSKELGNLRYNLEYLIYSTRRFGVEFRSIPCESRHIDRSEGFISWFNFWQRHFESMDWLTYNSFICDKLDGKDVSSYLPDVKWCDELRKLK